jgi:hypothetical protein
MCEGVGKVRGLGGKTERDYQTSDGEAPVCERGLHAGGFYQSACLRAHKFSQSCLFSTNIPHICLLNQ